MGQSVNEQSIKPEFKSFFPHPSPFIALKILGRVLGNVFVALTGAYGLNLTLFLLLRLLVGERWTFMAIFNSVLHLLLIPPPAAGADARSACRGLFYVLCGVLYPALASLSASRLECAAVEHSHL
jgi:hypothetical protein